MAATIAASPVAAAAGDPCAEMACDDYSSCTVDTCVDGVCYHVEDCDDGELCTVDFCADASCAHYPLTPEECSIEMFPKDCTELECDDGNPCTVDACHWSTGCWHTSGCYDGDPCTLDVCEGGECLHVVLQDCDDDDPCTYDGCDPDTLVCQHQLIDCADGDPCTDDLCVDGVCTNEPVASEECAGCTELPDEVDLSWDPPEAPLVFTVPMSATYCKALQFVGYPGLGDLSLDLGDFAYGDTVKRKEDCSLHGEASASAGGSATLCGPIVGLVGTYEQSVQAEGCLLCTDGPVYECSQGCSTTTTSLSMAGTTGMKISGIDVPAAAKLIAGPPCDVTVDGTVTITGGGSTTASGACTSCSACVAWGLTYASELTTAATCSAAGLNVTASVSGGGALDVVLQEGDCATPDCLTGSLGASVELTVHQEVSLHGGFSTRLTAFELDCDATLSFPSCSEPDFDLSCTKSIAFEEDE